MENVKLIDAPVKDLDFYQNKYGQLFGSEEVLVNMKNSDIESIQNNILAAGGIVSEDQAKCLSFLSSLKIK